MIAVISVFVNKIIWGVFYGISSNIFIRVVPVLPHFRLSSGGSQSYIPFRRNLIQNKWAGLFRWSWKTHFAKILTRVPFDAWYYIVRAIREQHFSLMYLLSRQRYRYREMKTNRLTKKNVTSFIHITPWTKSIVICTLQGRRSMRRTKALASVEICCFLFALVFVSLFFAYVLSRSSPKRPQQCNNKK